MTEKLYPFNMNKHQHDIFYRYNRAKNEYYDHDPEMTSEEDYNMSKRNYELMVALGNLLAKGTGIVWLTGREYALARESIMWADYERHVGRL